MFDDQIDRAARGLTNGSPSYDFRARVFDRIQQRQRRSSFVAVWGLAAAAVVIVIAIGIVNLRNAPEAPLAARVTATAPALTAGPVLPAPLEVEGNRNAASAPSSTARVDAPVFADVALLAPAPLEVASIEFIRLDAPVFTPVDALSIARIDIAPLDVSPADQP